MPKLEMYNLSVVICAYTEDRWEDLVASIASIKKQTISPMEIILVIDHNLDLFVRAKRYFPGILVIENGGDRGLSGARNSGIAVSNGDLIIFIDEDACATPDWLFNLLPPYDDPDVMGVGGFVEPYWITEKPSWFPAEFNWVIGCSYLGLPETSSVVRNMIGCNMSLRRTVFDSVGNFRSGIGRIGAIPLGCEETELCIRVNQQHPGSKFIFEPSARVLHRVPKQRSRFSYFLMRCYSEGISKALITSLIGRDGLSTEQNYTLKTLPMGIWNGILDKLSGRDSAGLRKAGAIMLGFGFTMLGYLKGKISLFCTLANERTRAQRPKQYAK